MNNIQKKLIKLIVFATPPLWLGLTISATCITWWHGYTWLFFCVALLLSWLAIPAILVNYKNFYIFEMCIFMTAILFCFYALVLLFFPQWNDWGSWNTADDWPLLHFSLAPNLSCYLIGLLASLFLIFGIKKMFEIDYTKMKKEAYKGHRFDRCDGLFYINKPITMWLEFNVHFLKKTEHYLHASFLTIALFFFLPFKALGSSMARNGNTLFNDIFFLFATYLFIWILYWFFLCFYAQYRLINKIEKELGVKLKPTLKDD